MAKFLSYFNLSRITDSGDLLGTSPDCVKGNIIVTLSRNIIIVVKISSQQQIISWSVQEKLSTRVIFDKNSKKYVGVFGSRFIRCWNVSTLDINSIKKMKLQKPVVDIVASKDDVLILYTDGTLQHLSEAVSIQYHVPIKLSVLDNPLLMYYNVKNIDVNNMVNGTHVVTYFVQGADNKEIDLVVIPLSFGSKQRRRKIGRKDVTVNLSGYAIVEGDTHLMLLTIWSDQRLFLLNLDEQFESDNFPGNFVSTISTLRVDTNLTIVGVARNCVAIYGANTNQEGASLLLYNTKFKVVKAQQYFKVYFDCSRIWIVDDNIILAMGQNLSVVTFHMSQELLVDLLGTYTQNHIGFEGDLINEEYFLQSLCVFRKNWSKNEKFHKLYCNYNNYRSYLTLEEKLSQLTCTDAHNQILIKVDNETSHVDDAINIVKTHSEKYLLNKTLIEFYIRHLVSCGATEQEISEKLLRVGAKIKSCPNIMNVISQLACIPEFVIAKCFFTMITEKISKASLKVVFPANICERFINNTVVQPIRNIAFMENFRNDMSSFFLLNILNYFYILITKPQSSKSLRSEAESPKLEMQAVYWFDTLLNAHFQHLALSREVEILNVLLKWAKLVIIFKNQIKKLKEILILLDNLIHKECTVERASTYMWYSIEDLCF